MDIEELETQISYYASKYYMGEPEISDEQFDMLVDRLRQLNPNSRVLKTGWGFEVNGDKVKHKYSHIGSLDKTKTYEDIPERFKQRTVYISPKLDGLSAVAYYENGQLVKGITRGNGEYGKDITDKLALILGTSIVDNTFTGAVRGELIISNDNWNELLRKYTNLIAPRNFAAGIINRKEIDEDIKYIDMVVYKVVGQEGKPTMTKRDMMLQWLSLNFKHAIPSCYYPVLNFSSWEAYHIDTFEQFKLLGYSLDGLVLDSPEIVYNATTSGYIFDEVAFKFNAETTETNVKEIEWTLSRTQRLVPVAVVEPVELSGAIIERATCNNAQMVQDLGLGKGARIEIQRANEVIPYIVNVIDTSDEPLPEYCPVCHSKLEWVGVDLKCNNKECPNVKLSDLQQWCESIGETDGLQWTLMKQYLDIYGVETIDDLYVKQLFILNDLTIKKLSITELKIKDFFEKLYLDEVPVEKALVGLNIPRLGEKTAKLFKNKKSLIHKMLLLFLGIDVQGEEYVKTSLLELVKEATTNSIFDNKVKFVNLKYMYSDDLETSRLKYEDVSSQEKKFIAVTGALTKMKRKDFEEYISKFGYELTTNLKKCQYLVTNTPDSGSTKNKQAKEYGIDIITEEDFFEKLKI